MGLLKILLRSIPKEKNNEFKGKVGEIRVRNNLNRLFSNDALRKSLNNLILKDSKGHTHQIDHIEIRQNGIFCVETKNYQGFIFGDETSDIWTQVLCGKKNTFPNPIKQNQSHVYHLSNALQNKYKINSLIVMVQNNALRIKSNKVINLCDINNYFKNYDDGTKLSSFQIEEIYNSILLSKENITNIEHIKNINNSNKQVLKSICPRCGGTLIERNGKYGRFIGCSNYPKCKFVSK